jgi:hypothetical protein
MIGCPYNLAMFDNYLWSVDADYGTPLEAARQFVQTYWSEPRFVEGDCLDEWGTFALENGRRRYQVKLVPSDGRRYPARYQIMGQEL